MTLPMPSPGHPERVTVDVIGSPIDVLGWDEAVERLGAWSRERRSRVACICNAHSLVTARQDSAFADVLRRAELCTPDGAPVAWMLRRLGHPTQPRINGPDLMWRYCAWAARHGESIYLYGGQAETLQKLQVRLLAAHPGLRIAGAWAPPFRPLTDEEDRAVVEAINASGAGTVWVGLGCPKQEFWMQAHRGRVQALMLGVGAAFDYHAGTLQRAPRWMQHAGLEWLHRLASEPRRLWRRYLLTNTAFIAAALRQWLGRR